MLQKSVFKQLEKCSAHNCCTWMAWLLICWHGFLNFVDLTTLILATSQNSRQGWPLLCILMQCSSKTSRVEFIQFVPPKPRLGTFWIELPNAAMQLWRTGICVFCLCHRHFHYQNSTWIGSNLEREIFLGKSQKWTPALFSLLVVSDVRMHVFTRDVCTYVW